MTVALLLKLDLQAVRLHFAEYPSPAESAAEQAEIEINTPHGEQRGTASLTQPQFPRIDA